MVCHPLLLRRSQNYTLPFQSHTSTGTELSNWFLTQEVNFWTPSMSVSTSLYPHNGSFLLLGGFRLYISTNDQDDSIISSSYLGVSNCHYGRHLARTVVLRSISQHRRRHTYVDRVRTPYKQPVYWLVIFVLNYCQTVSKGLRTYNFVLI